MMVRYRRLGAASGILLVLAGLTGCAQEQATVRLNRDGLEPSLAFEGFHMVSTQRGEREWDFYARGAQVFERENTARAQQIKVIYWRHGKVASTLTARRGFLRTDSRYIRAEQDVVMISEDGAVLRTEVLSWDNQAGKITTDQPVAIERGDNILTGVGLEADSELKHVQVLAKVNIRVKSIKTLRPATGKAKP